MGAILRAFLAVLCAAQAAHAAGMGIPDLGAAALGQAGATVARPRDLTALYYNPAGLAFLEGVQLYADVRLVDHRITYQRLDALGRNPAGWDPVSNQGGIAWAPVVGASWNLGPVTLAAGGHPATGATGYHYPDPAANPNPRVTSQRYLSIGSESRIYIPVLAAAVRLTPWAAVGAGLQLPIASFSSRQAVYAGPISGEFTEFDALLDLRAQQWLARSGVFGVSLEPLDWLQVGAALQLQTHFRASGTIAAALPQTAVDLGMTVTGDRMDVDIVFPWIARAGARVQRERWSLELAGTFEKWSLLRQIRITPVDMSVQFAGRSIPVPPLVLVKELKDAGSLRLGGEFRLRPWLALRAGVLYETSAIPEERQALDWLHWQRFSFNAGAGVTVGRFDASIGLSRFLQPDRSVRDSQIRQLTALDVAPTVIGNGDYHSQLTLAAFSISARL
jgi:long-subunit fatty acid transport protein